MKKFRASSAPASLRIGALASAISAVLSGAGPAQAQAPSQVPTGVEDEVLVTGSRIVRRDFEANSPIVTIDAGRFEETSNVAMESVINQLPQFVPAVSQFDARCRARFFALGSPANAGRGHA